MHEEDSPTKKQPICVGKHTELVQTWNNLSYSSSRKLLLKSDSTYLILEQFDTLSKGVWSLN